MLQLRSYQEQAIEAIHEHERSGMIRPLVVTPTGSGKTVIAAHLIKQRAGRALFLVHTDELTDQSEEKLRIVAPERPVGVVKAERNETSCPTTVASVATVRNTDRLSELLGWGEFTTVVVDEAHHAPARSWKYVLHNLGSLRDPREPGPLTCGFTATPERDGQSLEIWDPQLAYYLTIREMVKGGYLVEPRGMRVNTNADLRNVSKSDGDLAAGQLGTELLESGAIQEIADAVYLEASDRKGIAFLPTVATAKALARALGEHGIVAESVDGSMTREARRAVLHRLRTGKTQFVTNCQVLTEGFDEPSVDCIVIARPTVFHGLYVQMVGRGLRPYPGKVDCLVLDVVGATERHDMVSVIDLGVNPVQGSAGGTGEAPVDGEQRPCRLCGRQVTEERWLGDPAKGKPGYDYHSTCSARRTGAINLFKKSTLRWLPVRQDPSSGWCMPTDGGTLVIVPVNDDRWDLVDYTNGKLTWVNKAMPLEWAFGIGEDRAKAFGKLTKRNARWLDLTPTPAQLNRLSREGLPDSALVKVRTRGQAADLITRLQGRRAVARLERLQCR